MIVAAIALGGGGGKRRLANQTTRVRIPGCVYGLLLGSLYALAAAVRYVHLMQFVSRSSFRGLGLDNNAFSFLFQVDQRYLDSLYSLFFPP